ncbi:hypothetical protein AB833_06405 [Chromatiales bacterium (ex Bugula neritina AB1)]|nr:hypothetical protein AB833_06405 [Chromatiales bacterium (ex Bugula neritina AB1)]
MDNHCFYTLRTIGRSTLALFALSAVLLNNGTAAVIEKSPNDPRSYRALTLDNGMLVTLIHDSAAETASASMDVAVGAGSDPSDREGLAHFLEHMLFLGTKRYPEAGSYAQFIRSHGGSNNAYTSYSNTNYHFTIEADHLEPALDQFAQFFIAPLFTADLVQREKNAVHSEFTGKQKEDGLRYWSARKRGYNQSHPMSRFTTGNLQTLNDREDSDIRDELIRFYNEHYSSNIMSLAILGQEPLDQLEEWVRSRFTQVPNRNAERQFFKIPLFKPESLPSRMNITPLKDQRFLTLTFPIPKREKHRFTRPKSYIGNILGHEGENSLLSALKLKGWANSLSAGSGTEIRGAATFDVTIGLTEAGVNSIDELVTYVFRGINMVRESGLPEWIYKESQMLDELSFRYQEQASASAIVRALASRAQDWPTEKLISGPYRRSHFDTEGINEVLQHLVPDNLQLIVMAPHLETELITDWYDTPYSINPIPAEVLQKWKNAGTSAEISFPVPNEFLPEDLTLLTDVNSDPVNLRNTDKIEVWHRTDSSFGVPRANLNASIQTPAANATARSRVLTSLYVELVNEQLNEFSYPANLAGLGYNLSFNTRGLGIRLSGYTDGQRIMLEKLVAAMLKPEFTTDKFEQVRRELIDQIENYAKEAPYQRVGSEIRKLLIEPYFTETQRIAELNSITPEDLREFVAQLFKEIRIIALSHGNISADETLKRTAILEHAFARDATPAQVTGSLVVKVPQTQQFVRQLDIDHPDSSIAVYWQGIERHRASRARFALLRQILTQPFYDDLRTRQQLGYFVFTYGIDIQQVPSIVLSLQSPSTGPGEQLAAIEEFLVRFEKTLLTMDSNEFERHREALIGQVEQTDKRLSERTARYWSALYREDYIFDATERFSAAVKTLTKKEIVTLYRTLFIEKTAGRIVSYNEGSAATDSTPARFPSYKAIARLSDFKNGKTLYQPLHKIDGVE